MASFRNLVPSKYPPSHIPTSLANHSVSDGNPATLDLLSPLNLYLNFKLVHEKMEVRCLCLYDDDFLLGSYDTVKLAGLAVADQLPIFRQLWIGFPLPHVLPVCRSTSQLVVAVRVYVVPEANFRRCAACGTADTLRNACFFRNKTADFLYMVLFGATLMLVSPPLA